MKFEQVLSLMRDGKKGVLRSLDDDGGYWVCGTAHFLYSDEPPRNTVIRCEKNGKHIATRHVWGIPLWALMSEEWEVIDD